MKKILVAAIAVFTLASCAPKVNDLVTSLPVHAKIDLVNVEDDKIMVEVNPGRFTVESITYFIPKTVPGTYSNNDYGQFIENFKAYDYKGNELEVTKPDINSWLIANAQNLDKITYWVKDSFDTEYEVEEAVFSPAGTNIDAGKNYFLNLHMLVGYFKGLAERPYQLTFLKPDNFVPATSLQEVTASKIPGASVFTANRYFEVTDNPIMFSEPNSESFKVNDIEVTLSVYSPNKTYTAASIKPDMEKMMTAQKAFLGDVNATKTYHILLYLSTMQPNDAKGMGALEHHTSTTVVLPESMPKDVLVKSMVDVVSHEFFHIVTPLTVHSEEVHYFDYNNPKMSKHLWMYEGVTEYFAQLFQIQQGLITEQEFYDRINGKIQGSKRYDDTMSFTEMSQNILKEPYKENYVNVYEKGALIGMCIDLILREESKGEKGILWLMKQLSNKYGIDKPFDDNKIIDEIVALTYPEIGEFFKTHVIGNTPIDYASFLGKAGLEFSKSTQPTGFFLNGQIPFIDVDPSTKEVFFRETDLGSFLNSYGIQSGDIIKTVNGTDYNLDNIRDLVIGSFSWKEGDDLNMTVLRNGEEVTLTGKITNPTIEVVKLAKKAETTPAEDNLRNNWMKK